MSTNGYANPAALVSTEWVAEHRDDPTVVLIEVDVDTTSYDQGHIPGAIGWHWQRDLQRRPVRDIPTKEEWEALLSRSGIDNDSTVILFGDSNNWFAAFAYWLFKLYGHERVALMDGGRQKWLDDDCPISTDLPEIRPAIYVARAANTRLRATRAQVHHAIGRHEAALVDVRSPQEYSGELLAPAHLPQEGAQRGGHVPGAKNIPWGTVLTEGGTFKDGDDLRQLYSEHGVDDRKSIITYCRIGERSAHSWFVLTELLGYPDVRNYDGSWTEWGSLVGAPIER